jgi:hypothetical protein
LPDDLRPLRRACRLLPARRGSFEFTFSRFATESGLRVNFRAADGYRTPQKTTPLSCGTTYELERDTYIVEIGPTASEYVRIIISPPLD